MKQINFNDSDLHTVLEACSDFQLDEIAFGVIAIDDEGAVRRYNAVESKAAGLSRDNTVGNMLFTVVAPCMNNFMVAQRFQDARENGEMLDDVIDYVLTLRMRPKKVQLRLLSNPAFIHQYIAVQW